MFRQIRVLGSRLGVTGYEDGCHDPPDTNKQRERERERLRERERGREGGRERERGHSRGVI